jgi:hypothetical protein
MALPPLPQGATLLPPLPQGATYEVPIDFSIPTERALRTSSVTPPKETTLGQKAIGVGEAALTTATGIPASLIGAYGGLVSKGKPEETMARLQSKFTYQPRTQAGQEITEALGNIIQSSGIQGLAGMGNIAQGMPYVRGTTGASKVADVSQKALNTASDLVKKPFKTGTNIVAESIGLTTGAGGESIKQAFKTGYENIPDVVTPFKAHLRGEAPITDVLETAQNALGQIKATKNAQYVDNMSKLKTDRTVLDMTPILDDLSNIQKTGTFKGKVIKPSAVKTQQELSDVVVNWAKEDPAQYHTPEGLDALKQRIGDIVDSQEYGSPSRTIAEKMYNSVKSQIVKQAPVYENTMKQYSEASQLIKEIERSLSLGKNSTADTAVRKLQSITRNNANTNYGQRLSLVQELEKQGAASLIPNLAAQSLSSFTPRGIQRAAATGVGGYGALTFNPLTIPALALSSPRLMGETALGLGTLAGKTARGVKSITPSIPRIPLTPQQAGLLSLIPQNNE